MLRQGAKTGRGELRGSPRELEAPVRADAERILSLDVDGQGFGALGERDPVIAALQRRYPGLRPVLFYTPYEAAAWTIIGRRIRMTQAATIRQRLAAELGEHGAFPGPDALISLSSPQRGLAERAWVALLLRKWLEDEATSGCLD